MLEPTSTCKSSCVELTNKKPLTLELTAFYYLTLIESKTIFLLLPFQQLQQ
jgi:hypothetical protein